MGMFETGWEGGGEKLAETGIPVGASLRSIAPLDGLPDSMVEQFCWFLEIPGCVFSLPGFKEFRRF
jgi:hypothetical protein